MKSQWLEIARKVLDIEREGLKAVSEQLDGGFTRAVELLLECTGRVVVTGIGKSGLVCRKIAATLSSTGTPAYFLHPVEGAHGDLGLIREGDVVLAISNSGETDELNAILPSLRSLGARIISMTSNEESRMGRLSDVVIPVKVPREACPMDLAPTASTTAALAVGDALAVCLIDCKSFSESDFKRRHPGGALGQRLSQKITEMMHTEDLPVCSLDTPLEQALRIMTTGGLGFLAVLEDGRLSGVLTDGDVRRLAMSGGLQAERRVAEVVGTTSRFIYPDETAAHALDMMEESEITVLPVVDTEHTLLGMIHLHDLLGKGMVRFS